MKKIVYLLVALDDHCKVHRLILVASMNETFLKDPKFMLDCSCTACLSPRIEVKSCLQSTDPQEPLFNFLLLHYECRQPTTVLTGLIGTSSSFFFCCFLLVCSFLFFFLFFFRSSSSSSLLSFLPSLTALCSDLKQQQQQEHEEDLINQPHSCMPLDKD